MYYKLELGRVATSAMVKRTWDGDPVSDFTAWLDLQTPEARSLHGWRDAIVRDPHPGGTAVEEFEDDGEAIRVRWRVVVVPVRAKQLSKLALRKWLEARGLGGAFQAMLDSDPAMRMDWNDAVTLDDDDPKVLAVCDAFVAQNLLSDGDVVQMKADCVSPYQG